MHLHWRQAIKCAPDFFFFLANRFPREKARRFGAMLRFVVSRRGAVFCHFSPSALIQWQRLSKIVSNSDLRRTCSLFLFSSLDPFPFPPSVCSIPPFHVCSLANYVREGKGAGQKKQLKGGEGERKGGNGTLIFESQLHLQPTMQPCAVPSTLAFLSPPSPLRRRRRGGLA